MHEALRQRLGEHVAQKGSMVAPERLRFDFSHPAAIARDDPAWIEAEVNRPVRGTRDVPTRLITPQAATHRGGEAPLAAHVGAHARVVALGGAAAEGNPRA